MTELTWNQTSLPCRRLAGRAMAWWLGELAGLLPAAVQAGVAGHSSKTLRLEFTRAGSSLLVPGHDRSAPAVIPVAFHPDQRVPFDWARLAGAPVQIRLANNLVFRPVVDLPLAAETSLTSILGHQLERLVPLDPSSLQFAWNILERLPAKNRLRVEMCIVKQATIDRANALVRDLGLTPQAVIVDNRSHPPAVLWRARASTHSSRRERTRRRALEITGICLGLAAYAMLVWHLDARRGALRDLVSDLQTRTRSIQALSTRAVTAEKTLAQIRARLMAPSALAVLDALTRAIPLDASLSELHLQGSKIEIAGVAAHATMLLGNIEKEPLFEKATFLAPIVATGQGMGERFELGFQLKAAPSP